MSAYAHFSSVGAPSTRASTSARHHTFIGTPNALLRRSNALSRTSMLPVSGTAVPETDVIR